MLPTIEKTINKSTMVPKVVKTSMLGELGKREVDELINIYTSVKNFVQNALRPIC